MGRVFTFPQVALLPWGGYIEVVQSPDSTADYKELKIQNEYKINTNHKYKINTAHIQHKQYNSGRQHQS